MRPTISSPFSTRTQTLQGQAQADGRLICDEDEPLSLVLEPDIVDKDRL